MKKRPLLFPTLSLILFLLASCTPKKATPDLNTLINQAVAATLESIPTVAPAIPPTPYPTPTAVSLSGLYCEYQFCIGHPIDMAFFDVSAQKNPASPSTYSQGILASFNGNLFIQVMWQLAPGSTDPTFMLDLIVDKNVDVRVGTLDAKLIRNMNVISTAITSTATPVLPFGEAAAWVCGERVFAWKVYAPQAESTQALFDMAMNRFSCNQ